MAVTMLVCGMALAFPAFAGMAFAFPANAWGAGSELQQRMVAAVNQVRAQHGLRALHASDSLHYSAHRYAGWMLRTDYVGHLSRIRASNRFSTLGENLAWHSGHRPRVGATVRRWMSSPPHRAMILHRGFGWLGAGAARGTLGRRRVTAWVLHFGGALAQRASEASIPSALREISSTISDAGSSAASAAP